MLPDDQHPQTRPSLILRLRNPDDVQAWQEFVDVYLPVIENLARKRGLQEADAKDVTQEVLTRVAKSIGNWDPNPVKGTFRGWLSTMTRNLVVQFFRESKRRPLTGVGSPIGRELSTDGSNGRFKADDFDLERDRQLFLWAAHQVRPRFERKTWQAFWLTAVECQAVAIVADELGITKSQVYVARSRVMSKLKQAVERTEFDSFTEAVDP